MSKLFAAFKKFFAWWADLTGTETKHYDKKGLPEQINWPIVSFVVFLWILMLVFLPGGLVTWLLS